MISFKTTSDLKFILVLHIFIGMKNVKQVFIKPNYFTL